MTQAQRITRRFQDATARLETILFLGAMVGVDGEESPALAEFLEERPQTLKQCLPDMPTWLQQALERGEDEEVTEQFNFWCETAPKLGFIVKVATPHFTLSPGGSAAFSWGFYRSSWVYGDTFAEAVNAALAWVATIRKEEKAEPRLRAQE